MSRITFPIQSFTTYIDKTKYQRPSPPSNKEMLSNFLRTIPLDENSGYKQNDMSKYSPSHNLSKSLAGPLTKLENKLSAAGGECSSRVLVPFKYSKWSDLTFIDLVVYFKKRPRLTSYDFLSYLKISFEDGQFKACKSELEIGDHTIIAFYEHHTSLDLKGNLEIVANFLVENMKSHEYLPFSSMRYLEAPTLIIIPLYPYDFSPMFPDFAHPPEKIFPEDLPKSTLADVLSEKYQLLFAKLKKNSHASHFSSPSLDRYSGKSSASSVTEPVNDNRFDFTFLNKKERKDKKIFAYRKPDLELKNPYRKNMKKQPDIYEHDKMLENMKDEVEQLRNEINRMKDDINDNGKRKFKPNFENMDFLHKKVKKNVVNSYE